MRITGLSLFTAVVALLLTQGRLSSQTQAEILKGPKTPEEKLTELRVRNAELLERQRVTQEKLGLLLKEADQVRIFSKRS